ncbi:MAG: [FeFe] hydrogenase H-cluster maturation GTPase HydF [Firmicutes bacterium]|nr:[FeFe] hydrogenase H-cluster maturation GTPase HydF [Bacillota bacterium]
MRKTPESLRLHIGIFGRRNVGKSSLINCIARHSVSIVSPEAGTTTDPVKKAMELQPLGPVLLIDTAGLDDEGELGELRIKRTKKIIEATELAILVTETGQWGDFEDGLVKEFNEKKIPTILIINKVDENPPSADEVAKLKEVCKSVLSVSTVTGEGVEELRQEIIEKAPQSFLESPPIIRDLIEPGETAILVIPIDFEAPRGRILLPQSQSIRDVIDNNSICIVVKETELDQSIANLKELPKIVVTDSQAFDRVKRSTPDNVLLTSFSTLFARYKGDLLTFAKGAKAISQLKPGDKVLVAEACTHHPIGDDIGTLQIPRKFAAFLGFEPEFEWAHGTNFPEDLTKFKLIVHCGACVWNRKQVLSRIQNAMSQGVPITNYGISLAYVNGIFERALTPFVDQYPELKELFEK